MDGDAPVRLRAFVHEQLDEREEGQIAAQLARSCVPDRQVLWTGMTRELAQKWADAHNMQTLTTAMGPLMDTNDSRCPREKKSRPAWTKYVHGASAIFAWHISKGDMVTLLTNPPPQRFHPSGSTSFQLIEEPIITGRLGNRAVHTMHAVHPTVPEASDFSYQCWPCDHSASWLSVFGSSRQEAHWRAVKVGKSAWGVVTAATALQQSAKSLEKQDENEDQCSGQIHRSLGCLRDRHRAQRREIDRAESLLREELSQRHSRQLRQLKVKKGREYATLQRKQAIERRDLHKAENQRRRLLKKKQRKEQRKSQKDTLQAIKAAEKQVLQGRHKHLLIKDQELGNAVRGYSRASHPRQNQPEFKSGRNDDDPCPAHLQSRGLWRLCALLGLYICVILIYGTRFLLNWADFNKHKTGDFQIFN